MQKTKSLNKRMQVINFKVILLVCFVKNNPTHEVFISINSVWNELE